MLKFLGIIIEMGLVQMAKVYHYWSKSRLYGSEVIQNTMSRDKFELLLKVALTMNNRDFWDRVFDGLRTRLQRTLDTLSKWKIHRVSFFKGLFRLEQTTETVDI
jgi:hypothetical protein